MLMSKGLISSAPRAIALATIAALVLTTSESPLVAAPAAISTAVASSRATDFSAARRHRHYHRRGNAAGAAFVGMAFGLVAGAIAAQQRREYYENYDYYYGPAIIMDTAITMADHITMGVDITIRPTKPTIRAGIR